MKKKTAVVIINVGTPDKPEVKHVRRYLFKFLNDRRVIDLPWLLQKILVNLIIVPFRAPKSTKLYKMLWSENGSPLMHYTLRVKEKLEALLPENYDVYTAMRYEKPSLHKTLEVIRTNQYDEVIVIPQFPQYASSTVGTINQFIMDRVKKWNNIPDFRFVNQFYSHPGFISAFVKRAKAYNYQTYDHIIFSYHGLPLRQIDKVHVDIKCTDCTCHNEMPVHGNWCYRATCYETSRLLAKELKLSPDNYTVAFQSRLSKNWLEPFSDKIVEGKARQGLKKLLVFAPAFVADCLETKVEIGVEYKELFEEHGGEQLTMVESLNDMDEWVATIKDLVVNINVE